MFSFAKLEKLDYRLCKAGLDLEFLCKCKDNKVAFEFLNLRSANNHLSEKIRQKKSTVRNLQKEFNSLQASLPNELNLIDFTHASTLIFGINDKILKSESLVQ